MDFNKIIWQDNKFILNGLIFNIEDRVKKSKGSLIIYKTKEQIEAFAKFFYSLKNFQPKNIFEIGIWKGGSVLFWDNIFNPAKIVAIDNLLHQENVLVKFGEKNIAHIQQYYDINQIDRDKIVKIVKKEFSYNLDLVIDDASHLYIETKTSFETLFPLINENGFYIIEDWAWWHFPKYNNSFINKRPLTDLVVDLVKLKGSSDNIISCFYIDKHFIAVQKGSCELDPFTFKIDNFIINRPRIKRSIKYFKKVLKKYL